MRRMTTTGCIRAIPNAGARRLLLATLAVAWTAYPCPAGEARKVISLDGLWQIAEGGMAKAPARFDHEVAVPGLLDMAKPPFAEVGVPSTKREAFWYRRTFRVDEPAPAVAWLKVHKAAFGARVWLNGQPAGEHVPCFTPGLFDLHEHLKGGGAENELLIRVGASRDSIPKGIPSGHDFEKRVYVPGIYDSVEVILTGSPYVVRVQTVPDIAAKMVRAVAVLRTADAQVGTRLACTVREAVSGVVVGTATSDTVRIDPGEEKTVDVRIPIKNCRLWSPEDPFLYELEVATAADSLKTRFGMRSFRFDKASGRAFLNGQPYMLRGTNVCIFRFFEDVRHGDKAWREEWVRKLHRAFREMHWNSIRYCIGFPPELWYRIADEEGLLIQDEFPIWYGRQWPPEIKSDELITEYTEWIRERCNHPCVVLWDACNETITTETGKAIRAVRGIDLSNRPWDNGYNAPQEPGDSFECHPYVFNNAFFRLSQLSGLPPTHIGNARPNSRGNPMIINEYGWLWLNRDGTPCTLTAKVYENLLGTDATPAQRRLLYARYLAALTEYWRAQRRFAGVLHFCGLSYSRDGGQTSDNFIDLDTLTFEPEFHKYVRDAFAPVGVMIDDWEDELTAGEPREFPVVLINDLYEACMPDVRFRILRGEKVVFEASQTCEVKGISQTRLTFKSVVPAEPGRYQLVAEIRVDGAEPVRSLRDFEVLSSQEREARRGVAQGKAASASSVATVDGESFPAEYAVDGNLATRWSSEFSDPQWIAIDLGDPVTISRVELLWENAYAKAYKLQVSRDGKEWTDVYATDSGRGGREAIRFAPTQTRWVRMLGTRRATQFGYSLWELRVFR